VGRVGVTASAALSLTIVVGGEAVASERQDGLDGVITARTPISDNLSSYHVVSLLIFLLLKPITTASFDVTPPTPYREALP
jgi:hypothetical protein